MGRPPVGAVLVDGRWEATPEGIALAAQKVLQQRQSRRERYKKKRDLIRQQHPELFKQRETQTKLLPDGDVARPRSAKGTLSTKSSDPSRFGAARSANTRDDTTGTLLQWLMH